MATLWPHDSSVLLGGTVVSTVLIHRLCVAKVKKIICRRNMTVRDYENDELMAQTLKNIFELNESRNQTLSYLDFSGTLFTLLMRYPFVDNYLGNTNNILAFANSLTLCTSLSALILRGTVPFCPPNESP